MNYPLISEYVEAIKAAEDNFEQLKHLRPVLDDDGMPVMSGGNFAVVFKMKDEQTGKLHAVKCFLKEQEGRAEAYRQIAEELEYVSSTFLTPIKYLDKEFFVDSANSEDSEFPVLLMDWVEGQTLDKYIREHIDDQYELSLLAYQFSRLAMWLMPQPFAHGDLKPDNILVKEDGTLVLVDYDGMYVPAMKGQKARELGSPDFRHPGRTEEVFDDHIDDFSLASILLSLKAIALQPLLLEEYGASDRLLFSEKDYRNLSDSSALGALQPLMQDAELASLYSLYILALSQNNLSQVSFRLFNLKRPKMTKKDIGLRANRNNKKETIENEYVDLGLSVKWATCNIGARKPEEFGDYFQWGNIIPKNGPSSNKSKTGLSFNSKYNSSSGKTILEPCDDTATCLLGSPWRMPSKKEITELINSCEWKEEYLNGVKGCRVIGPNGNSIFLPIAGGYSWGRPYSTGKGVYWSSTAYTQQDLVFNNSWFLYFKNSKPSISYYDRSCAYSIRPVLIEDENLSTEVTDEDLANAWTDEYGVKYSQDKRRLLACNLGELLWNEWSWKYTIRKETKVICDNAFAFSKSSYHNGETFVTLPDGLISIGNFAFMGLSLKSIIIPKSTTAIANDAFVNNVHLSSIVVDKRNHVFDSRNNCNAIIETKSNTLVVGCASTIIPSNIIKIGSNAFYGCINLKSISLPNSVVSIEDFAFYGCEGLKQFSLPNDIKSIGDSAFDFNYLFLPDSILHIGNGYNNCRLKRFYANKETQKRILDIHPEYSCLFDDSVSTKYDFNNALEDEFGAKYSSDKRCLLSVPIGLKEYMIKEGTEIICNYAFVGGSYNDLKKMALIHKKVNAESIVLPNSINTIGKYALSGCNNLQSIVIPIGTKEKFEELLPDYKDKFVEQVDEENLSTEVTEEDLANAWIDEFGVKYSADRKRLLKAPKGIEQYDILSGTLVICDGAFSGCIELKNIFVSDGLIEIGRYSFYGCESISNFSIPNSVRVLRERAFSGCTGLTSIMIPGSVQDISEYVFECCDGLTSIIVDGNNDIYDSRNNCNAIIDSRNNTLIQGCRSTIIPENIAVIGYGAFSRCRFLTSIIIPKGIREIKSYAFSNCSGLKTIDIPYGVNEIGESVFSGCSQLESISLPNSIIKIGSFAFCGCDLREITLPNSISEIGEDIFEECYSLDKIIIPQGVIGNFTHNSPLYGHLIVN